MCVCVCVCPVYIIVMGSRICIYIVVNKLPSGGDIGKVNNYPEVIGYAASEYDIVNNILGIFVIVYVHKVNKFQNCPRNLISTAILG